MEGQNIAGQLRQTSNQGSLKDKENADCSVMMWLLSSFIEQTHSRMYLPLRKQTTLSLGVSTPLCILELSRLTRIEKAVKNTTIFVIYKMLVYIQTSQPTTCFCLFLGHLQVGYLSQRKCTIVQYNH